MRAIITAVAENGVIGRHNKLPWHFPEDLKWFQSVTVEQTVVMGRRTYDSLPDRFKPLPHRDNVVLTRQQTGFTKFSTVTNKITGSKSRIKFIADISRVEGNPIFYIGGSQVYKLALPIVDQIYLTRIPGDHQGDVYFPDWPLEDYGWKLDQEVNKTSSGLRFQIYRREES